MSRLTTTLPNSIVGLPVLNDFFIDLSTCPCIVTPFKDEKIVNSSFWLDQSKSQIKQSLKKFDREWVEFVHWLAIPGLGLLLHFDHQICRQVTTNCYNHFFANAYGYTNLLDDPTCS